VKKIIFSSILILLLACSGKKSYSVKGTIIEIRKESNEFLIHHDEIPGFMMAMTMPFKLADSLDINRYGVGDSLKFRLEMKEGKVFANNFQLLGKGTLPETDNLLDDEYTPLEIGGIFNDVNFLDMDSNGVSLSDSDGKFRFISYIFTRCPMPNMCPAVVAKNRYLAETFSETDEIEFILISFDYIFDTPSAMKSIYNSHVKSNPNMKFYSSFGHLNDIIMLAGQSLVSFWGVDENDIGHTLRSVIIDPERRLMKVFEGTDWRPEAAERDIRNILKAHSL
jgi:protein SCO1/2